MKKGFLLAAIIYLFNSLGNVAQGILIKHYQQTLSIGVYEMIAIKCLVACLIMLPFAWKYLKHFHKNLKIVLMLSVLYSLDLLCCNTGFKTVPINTGTLILLLIPLWIVVLGRVILNEKSIIIPLGLILQKRFSDCRPVPYALFTNAFVLGIISLSLCKFELPALNSEVMTAGLLVALCDLVEFAGVYIAYQMAEAALLQPIRFTRILISMVLSYIILSERPTSAQVIGAVMIIAANAFSIWYSRKYQSKKYVK